MKNVRLIISIHDIAMEGDRWCSNYIWVINNFIRLLRYLYIWGLTVVGFHMMTSSNGNIFLVTGHLYGEFTPHKGQWRGALMFSLICVWINSWGNNCQAGDLRCYHAHYDVIAMNYRDMMFLENIHTCLGLWSASVPQTWPKHRWVDFANWNTRNRNLVSMETQCTPDW